MASSSGCARPEDERSSPAGAGRDARASRSEPPAVGQRFPRSCRLTSRRQFLSVYQQGRRQPSSSFVLFGLPNDTGTTRLGLTVTRKVGPAVVRNRIKRRLREVFRRNRPRLDVPIDLVVNARAEILDLSLPDLEREFLSAYRRLARRIGS